MSSDLLAVELFSGAGGLSIGLEKAGFKIVLANEIEREFSATFSVNHPHTRVITSDIHTIDFKSEIAILGNPKISLVSGGPPCQGFSTVGSKNKQDTRNSLFYEYLRVVAELKPDYIIFENVSGFKKMYEGEAYETLLSELSFLGYECNGSILEAADFGLPQRRQRTIIVGWLRGLKRVELPQRTHFEEVGLFGGRRWLSLMDAISDLPSLEANSERTDYNTAPLNEYQSQLRGACQILTEHNSSKYGEKMLEILSLIPPGGTIDDLPERLRPKSYFKNTYARLIPNQPSPTITRNFGTPSSSRCVHPFQNRALSTREGARLQGFPDDYKFYGSKISKNLQIGNAVPPIFGEVIARKIVESMRMPKEHHLKETLMSSVESFAA